MLAAGLQPSLAQAGHSTPPLPPVLPPQAHEPAPPPYDARLNHLAEIMGTLAFMRDLCRAGDGAAWREKMASLLESEGATDIRKERLAGSFNRGFDGYRMTYRTCTPAAQAVITRSLSEGARISADLARSFGIE
jgi:uncharacterized protein (TIGR02301 family)